jgi:hypothetical protein
MSRRYDIEVLPPNHGGVPARQPQFDDRLSLAAPVIPDGVISSALARWRADRQTRTWAANAATMRAAKDFCDAQLAAMESYLKCEEAGYRIQHLGEKVAGDLARQRAERAEEFRELQHQHDLAHFRRLTELADTEAKLVEATQSLQVQHALGFELAHTKRRSELLELQMGAAEREALLHQHLREQEAKRGPSRATGSAGDEVIDEALYQMRASLNASGLDTSGVDAVIDARKAPR